MEPETEIGPNLATDHQGQQRKSGSLMLTLDPSTQRPDMRPQLIRQPNLQDSLATREASI